MTTDEMRRAADVLGFVVEAEAKRVLSDAQLQPDPVRIADGWERRFVTDVKRAAEVMELYGELGFEVCADPVKPEQVTDDCADCQLVMQEQFKTIYTRRKTSAEGQG